MATIVLTSVVREDGSILIEHIPGVQPGEVVTLTLQEYEIPYGISIEEAKLRLAEQNQREMTAEEIMALEKGYAMFDEATIEHLPAMTVSMAEAKRWLAEEALSEMTPDDEAEYHRLNEELRNITSAEIGLPNDYFV